MPSAAAFDDIIVFVLILVHEIFTNLDDQSTEMKAGCAASYAQLLGDITEADSGCSCWVT